MRLRVLTIEDSPTDALLLERELRCGGYEFDMRRVDTRRGLAEALAGGRWDVVISDYALPGWNGTEALAIVQEWDRDLPFILVSGTIGEEIAVRAIQAGANDYLMKDRLARLPVAVARALEEAERRRDRRREQAALAFLAQASASLSESLEQDAIVEMLVSLAVPLLGDRAMLALVTEPGTLKPTAADAGPCTLAGAELDAATERVAFTALSRLEPVFEQAGTTGDLPDIALMALPLVARGDALAVLTLVVRSPRSFVAADVSLAEEFGRRASVALENARLYKAAQMAIAVREEFLLIASHELKTPLTPLMLQLHALVRASAGEATASLLPLQFTRDLDATLRHVRRLAVLVDQLLDVSSLGSARLRLVCEHLDLGAFADEIAQGFQQQAGAAGSLLEVHIDGPVWGTWDRTRMGQLLTNLLSNAFKFGAGKPVEVSVARDGSIARLRVRDGGPGIASADRARVFARFERAVSVRSYGGFGLGLWVARQVVEAHGGTIDVSGEPDEGATFTVELPAE